jgi:hypothetical protein
MHSIGGAHMIDKALGLRVDDSVASAWYRPEVSFPCNSGRDKKTATCISEDVLVPVHAYRHIPLLQPTQQSALHVAVRTFWRGRGCALELLLQGKMMLDVPEVLRQVAIRGGFWACSAAQVCS